jgi:hypothetical protein
LVTSSMRGRATTSLIPNWPGGLGISRGGLGIQASHSESLRRACTATDRLRHPNNARLQRPLCRRRRWGRHRHIGPAPRQEPQTPARSPHVPCTSSCFRQRRRAARTVQRRFNGEPMDGSYVEGRRP